MKFKRVAKTRSSQNATNHGALKVMDLRFGLTTLILVLNSSKLNATKSSSIRLKVNPTKDVTMESHMMNAPTKMKTNANLSQSIIVKMIIGAIAKTSVMKTVAMSIVGYLTRRSNEDQFVSAVTMIKIPTNSPM